MGNMWNCIIFETQIKDGEKLCTLKNKEGTIIYYEDIPEEKFDELLDNIEKKAKKEGKTANEYLDTTRRERLYLKYADSFKLKFHHHFDGEVLFRQKKGEDILELFGAHNHDVIGTKIQLGTIRKPPGVNNFHDLPPDVPFKANVEMKYNTGVVKKTNTSSFFPRNWDIKRVKEEIALVYDEMLKSGKVYDPRALNRKFDYPCSDGSFRIQIEFDELGNLTSAYPIVN
ncbi:hypothetical protein QFZ37_000394 [Chryseobacterium ginsenosidimutans]|uniref:hypothetical protein n=1 Tax=Chryseobacterium ginsenosidimutans TaxID=687846 RepID=UPI00277E73CE|nr:hypothetical protein [Chryseobacterium ginsenosidimutans]MDQ0592025.1 hypothetical protein [Chryseobacterium ginsenosidimutans]